MNMLKTNLLLLTFGLSMFACAADDQPTATTPTTPDVQAPMVQDTTAEDIRNIRQTLDALSHNPAIKAGDVIDMAGKKISQIPGLVRNVINEKDAQYREALNRAPYATVAKTVGGVIAGSVIGLVALAAYAAHKRDAYWDQYRQDCAKRNEELKCEQEAADHAWVQEERRKEAQQAYYGTYYSEPCCK